MDGAGLCRYISDQDEMRMTISDAMTPQLLTLIRGTPLSGVTTSG